MSELHVIVDAEPLEPALDTGVSHALLQRVAAAELPPTLRLARPAPAVVFGKRDGLAPGYAAAVDAARAAGFEAVLRLAGGRAAVFHEQTLELAHVVPDSQPRRGIHARFEATAAVIARALTRLGIDARVGEVPGEYCPGSYSVNAGGERKLAGIGQRLIAGASYMGGVLVVADSARVNDVLPSVYAALGLSYDPATTGAVGEELMDMAPRAGPGTIGLPSAAGDGRSSGAMDVWTAVLDGLLAEYAERYELVEDTLDQETLALAQRLAPEHCPA